MRSVTIIGVGRIGGAFAIALRDAGYSIELLVSKDPERTGLFAQTIDPKIRVSKLEDVDRFETDILLITTRDSEIRTVADRVADIGFLSKAQFAFHSSGVLSSDELHRIHSKGVETGSIHPLISVSDAKSGAGNLKDAYFCIEGTQSALSEAAAVVIALGGRHFEIEKDSKVLYHAAAVLACGHLTALLELSTRALENCGVKRSSSIEILMPLIRSTILNIENKGTCEALTGPFARADLETIQKHLAEFEDSGDEKLSNVYKALGEISLEIAESNGVDAESAAKIRESILLD